MLAPDPPTSRPGADYLLSTVLRRTVHDADGRPRGQISDLVVDLGADDQGGGPRVTGVALRRRGRPGAEHTLIGTVGVAAGRWVVTADRHGDAAHLRPTELLLGRDVLDAPAVAASRRGRGRVSDVLLHARPSEVVVVGLDLNSRGVAGRLLGGSFPRLGTVPLAAVHLGSPRGHAAQLAAHAATLDRLPTEALAEVLTHAPLAHAREILDTVEDSDGARAVALLHPELRDRLTGGARPPRRLLRFRGWRSHRPHRDRGGRV